MSVPENPVNAKPVPWYFDNRFVCVMLFIFGPLALPLVWLSPKFSITWKVIVTILAIVLTALLAQATVVIYRTLIQRLKDIQAASTI